MENVLYELNFDYAKAISFCFILIVGIAFFFADKIIGKHLSVSVDVKRKTKEISPFAFKIVTRAIGLLCLAVFLIFFGAHIADYHEYKEKWEAGKVSLAEGYVENYSPMPPDGKGTESFEIDGVYFAYPATFATNGYDIVADRGGFITRNGQYLKIKYVTNEYGENIILYIAEIE